MQILSGGTDWSDITRVLNNNGYDQKNEPTMFLPSGVHTKPKPKTRTLTLNLAVVVVLLWLCFFFLELVCVYV